MRIVFDTNILISILIAKTKGKPLELFNKAVKSEFQLLLSKEIIDEFQEVCTDQKISKYVNQEKIKAFVNLINTITEPVEVKSSFSVVKADPDDDIILRTAFDGKADFIVSGDKHLLSLKEFRGIKICTINEMLDLLG